MCNKLTLVHELAVLVHGHALCNQSPRPLTRCIYMRFQIGKAPWQGSPVLRVGVKSPSDILGKFKPVIVQVRRIFTLVYLRLYTTALRNNRVVFLNRPASFRAPPVYNPQGNSNHEFGSGQ